MEKMKKLVKKLYSEEVKTARASLAADFQKAFRGLTALIALTCIPGSWVVAVTTAFGLELPSFFLAVSPGITATLIAAALCLRIVQFALECNPKPKTNKQLARP